MAYTEEPNAKYTIKDSVFCDLFAHKEYLLQLYQFLHPEDENVTEEELEIQTIQNVLVDVLPPHARDFSRELGGFLLEF